MCESVDISGVGKSGYQGFGKGKTAWVWERVNSRTRVWERVETNCGTLGEKSFPKLNLCGNSCLYKAQNSYNTPR